MQPESIQTETVPTPAKSSAVPLAVQRVFLAIGIAYVIFQMVYVYLIFGGLSDISSEYWRGYAISYGVPLLVFFATYFIHPPTTRVLTRVFNSALLMVSIFMLCGMVGMLFFSILDTSGNTGNAFNSFDTVTWVTQAALCVIALGTMLYLRLKKHWQ